MNVQKLKTFILQRANHISCKYILAHIVKAGCNYISMVYSH